MSARVLLNLLNELGNRKRCESLPSIIPLFPKFSNAVAQMQDFIYHMTLKSH